MPIEKTISCPTCGHRQKPKTTEEIREHKAHLIKTALLLIDLKVGFDF